MANNAGRAFMLWRHNGTVNQVSGNANQDWRIINHSRGALDVMTYGSGHEGAPVLLPGFATDGQQNQMTRQANLRDLTRVGKLLYMSKTQLTIMSEIQRKVLCEYSVSPLHITIMRHHTMFVWNQFCFSFIAMRIPTYILRPGIRS